MLTQVLSVVKKRLKLKFDITLTTEIILTKKPNLTLKSARKIGEK